MYIYGLDLSMVNTGIAVFDTEIENFVEITSISTKDMTKTKYKGTHDGMRLKRIYEGLLDIIEKYPPSIVVIERGFSRHNISTQVSYRVHGIANLAFAEYEQIYYTPMAIKSTVYHSSAQKDEIATLIERRLGAEFMNYDESDACAVVLTHIIKEDDFHWSDVYPLTRKQKDKTNKK